MTVEISIGSCHVKFADPDIVVYEKAGFGFDVGGGTTVNDITSFGELAYLGCLNLTLHLEVDLSNFLSWPR